MTPTSPIIFIQIINEMLEIRKTHVHILCIAADYGNGALARANR